MIPGILATAFRTWPMTPGMYPLFGLEFEGSSGSSRFIERTGRTVLLSGSPVLSDVWKHSGATSGLFVGAQALVLNYTSNMNLGTSDWRLRVAFRPTSTALGELMAHRNTADNNNFWLLRKNANQTIRFFSFAGGSTITDIQSSGAATVNAGNVLDIRRTSGVVSMSLNGSSSIVSTTNATGAYVAPNQPLQIARGDNSGSYLPGYLDAILFERAP